MYDLLNSSGVTSVSLLLVAAAALLMMISILNARVLGCEKWFLAVSMM